MKLYFKFFAALVFFVLINFTTLFANDFKATYVLEIGKFDIGRLLWDVKISNNSYKILIRLKSKGFMSKLYKFEGSYETSGSVVKGSLMPLKYNFINFYWFFIKRDSFYINKIYNVFIF